MTETTTWPVIGHDLIVAQLAHAVESGQVAHAYLLSGPDHIGKERVALTFAQALLCTAEEGRPCGECRACTLVKQRRHPDLLTLDKEWQATALPDKKSAQSVTVDAVRLMNSDLQRRPHEGSWKVLLVPYVEELTVQAANAFLKTLEEPPEQVVILLTTRDAELVLPTIRSRCRPLPMRPLAVRRVAEALRMQWGRDEVQARLLARLSGGRMGWAIRAVEDEALLQRRSEVLAVMHRALRANRAERLLMAADLSKNEHAVETLQTWASWWRDMLLLQSGTSGRISHLDQQAELEHVASRVTREQTRQFLRDVQHLTRTLEQTNASPQLVWEVLLLKLPVLSLQTFERSTV